MEKETCSPLAETFTQEKHYSTLFPCFPIPGFLHMFFSHMLIVKKREFSVTLLSSCNMSF